MNLEEIKIIEESIEKNISKVIKGKSNVIKLIITSFLCSGHVLLEDVPGVGKTIIAKSLAKSIDCNFKRIQFTPDLLPTDLTGVNFFNQKKSEFEFKQGPIFANIILADEINRATPRTQSSLLECMDEYQVTIDGDTIILDKPFFVIATQNPIENQGTFPLPEAQLDRFLMRLSIGYPDKDAAKDMLNSVEKGHPFNELNAVCNKKDIIEAQKAIYDVKVSADIKKYILDIVEETRKSNRIMLGVSPRGSIALMRAAQAYAALSGRDYVIPDDVKSLSVHVLAHRIISKGYTIDDLSESAESLIKEIIAKVEVPIENIIS